MWLHACAVIVKIHPYVLSGRMSSVDAHARNHIGLECKCYAFVPLQLQMQLHSTWLCHLSCYGVNEGLVIREWKDEKGGSKTTQDAVKDRKSKLMPRNNYRDVCSPAMASCFK